MIEVPIYNSKGEQIETLAIDEAMLGGEVRPALLKQAYVHFHANQRQGSARTKNRSRIEGSTRKLYKQKHTGNARRGSVRTNLMKGGGVAFAKRRTREDYHLDMPRKMRRLANRNALLAKLVDSEVKCLDALRFNEPKTKSFIAVLEAVGIDRSCLVALDGANRNAMLSARNIPDVTTVRVQQLNAFQLLNHRYLVIDKASLQAFVDGSAWDGENSDGDGEGKKASPARKTKAGSRRRKTKEAA